MRADAVIVGGGPAGLYAAQHLARFGLAVHLLEEHERIGEPVHCTGILSGEALRLPGVPPDVVLGRANAARFHSPAGYELVYAGPDDEVFVIDRGLFDRGLAEAARNAGAKIVTGVHATRVSVERNRVVVHARLLDRPHVVSAPVCVLACGASYRLQRDLGWGIPPLFLGSAQTEVRAGVGAELEVFLRHELTPTGFGWFVPIARNGETRAKVGVMSATGARQALLALLRDLVGTGRVSPVPGDVVARLLPLAPLSRTYGDRLVAIGDAAGLVKPTTGGGIYYSLLSAQWAAEAIVDAFRRGQFSASVLRQYEESWRERLGVELRVGMWFRRLAARLTPGDLDALTRLARDDGLMPVIRAAARFNWHHELILQAVRHPGVLRVVLRRILGTNGIDLGAPVRPLRVASDADSP